MSTWHNDCEKRSIVRIYLINIGGSVKFAAGSREEGKLDRLDRRWGLKLAPGSPILRSTGPFRIEVSDTMFRPRGIAEQTSEPDLTYDTELIDSSTFEAAAADPKEGRQAAVAIALVVGLATGFVLGRYGR